MNKVYWFFVAFLCVFAFFTGKMFGFKEGIIAIVCIGTTAGMSYGLAPSKKPTAAVVAVIAYTIGSFYMTIYS